MLPFGGFSGAPQEALDCASGLYPNEPEAGWMQATRTHPRTSDRNH
jgi:hypothetical protein